MTTNWISQLRDNPDGQRLLEQERLLLDVTESIAALLEKQNVSRAELARRLGKSPAFVTKLLRGDNNFTLRTLSDVFFALNRGVHFTVEDIAAPVSVSPARASEPLQLPAGMWHPANGAWNKASMAELRLTGPDDGVIAA